MARKLYIPWSLPGTYNGRHPLVASLIDATPPPGEIVLPATALDHERVKRTVDEFTGFTARLAARFAGHPVVTTEDVIAFVRSRDALTHLLRPDEADLVFLHTVPNTNGAIPWVLHIENPTNLLMPFAWQGRTGGLRLRSLPAYWLVRDMLEQPECRAVFTHIRQTAESLGRIFESGIIASKTHHIPLGVPATVEQEAAIERAALARSSDEVVLLFTNSFHQEALGFMLRGGLDVVSAFLSAAKQAPNLRLILRTSLPDILMPGLREMIVAHPRITLIPEQIDDAALFSLHCEAHVFLVPSGGLHALSVARAMTCGMACIASDALGNEEYITDKVNGFLLPGRREGIYSVDEESGWVRDDYAAMLKPNPAYAARLAALLVLLARTPAAHRQIGARARAHAKAHLAFGPWADGFRRLLASL